MSTSQPPKPKENRPAIPRRERKKPHAPLKDQLQELAAKLAPYPVQDD